MTVTGACQSEYDATQKVYQWGIPKGQFGICYCLPDFLQQEQASANFRDGVVTISFPKREEAKPRRIEISV